ncbi:MAG TPA: glycerophosphodiester phosphodiesterase family protein [Steroidobacteraceae bacterium]
MKPARIIHLVAHRGNAHECPENTLPALRSALDLGARFLEIDVQLSADGVPVVTHDEKLTRTAGIDRSVFDLSAQELAQIEVAERGRFGARFAGTLLPMLTDVLELLEGRPEVTLFVEIKRASLGHFGHDQVVAKIVETLRPYRSQCVVISFDLPAIYRARQMGGLRIGWVLPAYDSHTRLKYETLQPEFIFCDNDKLPASGPLWRGPWHWAIYEITTLELALALAERGADYVETMAVRALSEAMRAHAVRRA